MLSYNIKRKTTLLYQSKGNQLSFTYLWGNNFVIDIERVETFNRSSTGSTKKKY